MAGEKIYILGIGGTFMAGIAQLAQALGAVVRGADRVLYPPMSEQLAALNIPVDCVQDFHVPVPNLQRPWKSSESVVMGNIMSRGMPIVEEILDQAALGTLACYSGPQWLYEKVLSNRKVIAVSGTHGKTTTASMLAWVLSDLGLKPGYLIGGIPCNLGSSANLGEGPYFVVEADEYDSACFDKRPKFLHYRPQYLIINNLEHDHADIYADLRAIQKQFHYLLRLLPASGVLAAPSDPAVEEVVAQGCWSKRERIGDLESWHYQLSDAQHKAARIYHGKQFLGEIAWSLMGEHHFKNALCVLSIGMHLGLDPSAMIQSLNQFRGVKRRLELKTTKSLRPDLVVYEDFGHHPTAIQLNLETLRLNLKKGHALHAVIDLASNSLKLGIHEKALPKSVAVADQVYFYDARKQPSWDLEEMFRACQKPGGVFHTQHDLLQAIQTGTQTSSTIVVFSNGHLTGLANGL